MTKCASCGRELGEDRVYIGGFEFCIPCFRADRHLEFLEKQGVLKKK